MELNLYLVRNLIDGSMYVGKTIKTIRRRWQNHLAAAERGRINTYLANAIRKYLPKVK